MILTINGSVAAIKKGTTFEYIAENRDFTEADGYTLEIELPLKDCQQNLAIFGHINRHDAPLNTNTFNATLQDVNFMKQGTVIITEITETAVKVQFLEGKSQQNNDNLFNKKYINELELGSNYNIIESEEDIEVMYHNKDTWPPTNMLKDIDDGQEFQALPWINNYSGKMQNAIGGGYDTMQWSGDAYNPNDRMLSWQIYLLSLTKRIFKAIGFESNFEEWYRTDYRFLLVCNTLPTAWFPVYRSYDISMSLPHWTIQEYIEQLQYLLPFTFDIEYHKKVITTRKKIESINDLDSYTIPNVVNSFSSKEGGDQVKKHTSLVCYKYMDRGDDIWKWCDNAQWVIDEQTKDNRLITVDRLIQLPRFTIEEFKTNGVIEGYEPHSTLESNIYYVKDINTYYGIKKIFQTYVEEQRHVEGGARDEYYTWKGYKVGLKAISLNNFHPNETIEDAEEVELKIVPAWIDDIATQEGNVTDGSRGGYDNVYIFLDCGELESDDETLPLNDLLGNGQQENHVVFDKIYVGYWKKDMAKVVWAGTNPDDRVERYIFSKRPRIEPVTIMLDGHYDILDYNKEEYRGLLPRYKYNSQRDFDIEVGYTYEFQWLGKGIPNPRAIFYIHGKRYLCEKITATFGENGMSELLKGTFYRLKD